MVQPAKQQLGPPPAHLHCITSWMQTTQKMQKLEQWYFSLCSTAAHISHPQPGKSARYSPMWGLCKPQREWGLALLHWLPLRGQSPGWIGSRISVLEKVQDECLRKGELPDQAEEERREWTLRARESGRQPVLEWKKSWVTEPPFLPILRLEGSLPNPNQDSREDMASVGGT